MKIVIIIALALLVLLDYAMCCMAHDADERADRMYRKWKEKDNGKAVQSADE